MQGKGIIVVFLILISLVCLWQYSTWFPTNKVEKAAERYAAERTAGITDEAVVRGKFDEYYSKYIDSTSSDVIRSIPLISDYTYMDLKSKQLAGGLDLVGGMSVLLQVDLKEYLKGLSENSNDKTFKKALDRASEMQTSANSDYISLFADAWREQASADPKANLYKIFQKNPALRDQINKETSDGQIFRILREKATETVKLTHNMLKKRIDQLGVVQPNVTLDAGRDIISVELPGIKNPERARTFLQAAAKLEFWHVYRGSDPVGGGSQSIIDAIAAADLSLKTGDTAPQFRKDTTYQIDSLGNVDSSQIASINDVPINDGLDTGPLLKEMTLNRGLSYINHIAFAERNKVARATELLEQVQDKFPRIKFLWGRKPAKFKEGQFKDKEVYALYAIKESTTNGKAPLEGDRITDSRAQTDPTDGVVVSLNMDNKGATVWAGMTKYAYENGQRSIAIVLDDKVVSAPGLNNGAITGGRSQISGGFTMQEGEDLASILKIGKLPAEPKIIQESLVGPSLGKKNIERSIRSLVIGFLLVFMFMIFYYGGGGIVSILSLFLNIFFIFGALASFGTVLTLPGIAGIVLTIGMAVDANVIIYERIREELRGGKQLRMAIQDGFSASYSAIIDANVTTIAVAFILIYFGLGPIKGFAVVLAIGVALSVFTAVLVGRMIIDWWTGKDDRKLSFWTGFSKNAFADMKIDWLGKKKLAYSISLGLLALSFISILWRGFELGVDFQGGYSFNVEFPTEMQIDADQLRNTLPDVFGVSTTVKAVDLDNTFNVVTSYLIESDQKEAQDAVISKLHEGINGIVGGGIDLAQFKNPEGSGVHVTASSKVGPTIADDISRSAKWATVFSLLFIFLYIFIRFSKWQYSMGAVAALAHDTVIVLGIFSMFHGVFPFAMEIDQAFIAAILTVIGYSINDTVVVFDRIREFMGTYTGLGKKEIINKAINSTVSRTVITSLTTLFVVAILFIFGGGSIRGFAFALLIGILVGTYSSIFIATPVMSDLTGETQIKKETKKKAFSKALR